MSIQWCIACNGGCQACNSCERCVNGCEGTYIPCTVCNTGGYCEGQCVLNHTFSGPNGCNTMSDVNSNGSFSFSVNPTATGSYMGPRTDDPQHCFNATVWNEIIDFFNNTNNQLSLYFGTPLTRYTPSPGTPFTAAEFNRLAEKFNAQIRVNPGDLIYGSYFHSLEDAVNNLTFGSSICANCNTSCAGCYTNCVLYLGRCDRCDNGCQNCNSGCNSNCNSNCNVCNTVQDPDDVCESGDGMICCTTP